MLLSRDFQEVAVSRAIIEDRIPRLNLQKPQRIKKSFLMKPPFDCNGALVCIT